MLALVGCGASLVHRRISTQTFRGPANCTSDQPYVSTKLDPQGWSEVHVAATPFYNRGGGEHDEGKRTPGREGPMFNFCHFMENIAEGTTDSNIEWFLLKKLFKVIPQV